MRRFFVCLVVCIREGFTPEKVAQLGHGGFLMLEYQKSSPAHALYPQTATYKKLD